MITTLRCQRLRLVSQSWRSLSTANRPQKKNLSWLEDNVELDGRHVLVRADLNVPLDKADPTRITDDTRIRAALPTIQRLINKNAKVVLCSHLGRPKGKFNKDMVLTPVATRLTELLGIPVTSLDECFGDHVNDACTQVGNGGVVLLGNLRFYEGEEKNDPGFAEAIADSTHAHIFVNDAFGMAHRAHASTEQITRHMGHSVAGELMEKELQFLQGAVDNPERKMAAFIGGSKVSTKLPVLETLINKCDKVLLGGAMIFTFYKSRGLEVGKSLVEDSFLESAAALEKLAKQQGTELLLPSDVVVAKEMSNDVPSSVVDIDAIPEDQIGLDIGPKSIQQFTDAMEDCRTILWNGPMGAFEVSNFSKGTFSIAEHLSECTLKNPAVTIVGGGDSVAAVHQAGVANKLSHVSTGGGASMELLAGKVLPGVAALDDF